MYCLIKDKAQYNVYGGGEEESWNTLRAGLPELKNNPCQQAHRQVRTRTLQTHKELPG